MESLDYWRLCDELSVIDAAILIIGADPSEMRDYIENWDAKNRPVGFDAARTALVNAIMGKRLSATLRYPARYLQDDYPNVGEIENTAPEGTAMAYREIPDWSQTTVKVSDLKWWLSERGFETGFFFPKASSSGQLPYLDKENVCYAPKLAAAVEAWTAITAEGKHETEGTPKQLMEKWLRENAPKFDLTKADGKLNEQGIADITKIANWKPEGGASKTPGSRNPPTPKKA